MGRQTDCAPGQFLSRLPARMVLAGRFVPMEGYARFRGTGTALQLSAAGRCAGNGSDDPWCLDGVRAPWVGEYFDRRRALP